LLVIGVLLGAAWVVGVAVSVVVTGAATFIVSATVVLAEAGAASLVDATACDYLYCKRFC
jgi:hypothetical protein